MPLDKRQTEEEESSTAKETDDVFPNVPAITITDETKPIITCTVTQTVIKQKTEPCKVMS